MVDWRSRTAPCSRPRREGKTDWPSGCAHIAGPGKLDTAEKFGKYNSGTETQRPFMTPTLSRLKKPFGTAKMVDLTAVRYLAWEDAFEVDFEDGLTFLEPHSTIRKANRISPKAEIARVEMDEECHEGFFVHYDNGQTAEVSWAFIRELPPRKQK
jgi:hypothetical protein